MQRRRHRNGRRRVPWPRAALWAGILPWIPGCTASEGLVISPVVIRSPDRPHDSNTRALESYYQTVFARMRDALHGGGADGLAELRYMIQLHKSDDMVEFAAKQMASFELLADGLEFELGMRSRCSIEMVTRSPHAHAAQEYRFRMRPIAGDRGVELGGSGSDTVRFQIHLEFRDFDAYGQHVDATHNLTRLVSENHELTIGNDLLIPFELPASRPQTVIRELKMTVEMLPSVVRIEDRAIPVSQITRQRQTRREVDALSDVDKLNRGVRGYVECCNYSVLLYPEGFENVERKPLKSMLVAMQRGTRDLFPYVFLSAHFMPEKDRETAMSRLIRWVRNGTPAQARAAMGSLRVLSREGISTADRDGWLLWWKTRTK